MTLVRSGSVALVLAASLVAIGCGSSSSSSPDTVDALTPATEAQGETSSALVVSKIEGGATLDITSADGACTSIRTLVEGKRTELQALCADKQIPVPVKGEHEGCDAGSATKITFQCAAVKIPPMPAEGCRDIEVKDDGAAIAEDGELPGALVCPRLGGAAPTGDEAEAEAPEPPAGEANDTTKAKPPLPTGDRPHPPLPPRDGGAAADGKRPLPPKGIRCCAPPPGGKPGGPNGAKPPLPPKAK